MSEHVRRDKPLFAVIAAQGNDLSPYDAVAEVRAMRAEKDAEDEREVGARPAPAAHPSCVDDGQ